MYKTRKINLPVLFLLLEALKFDLRIKVGLVFKKSDNSLHNGHLIIHFGLRRAEKTRFEVAYPTLKNYQKSLLLSTGCPTKNRLGFEGQKHFHF